MIFISMKKVTFTALISICGSLSFSKLCQGEVPVEQFYDFGLAAGDTELPANDDSYSDPLNIAQSFTYFGHEHSSLIVNNNGVISFLEPVSSFTPDAFPLGENKRLITPYWGDVDTTEGGQLWYRQATDSTTLTSISNEIQANLQNTFTATWSFIATWEEVAFYGTSDIGRDKRNTFQVVLATDGQLSFVIFNYAVIEWTTGTASDGDEDTGQGGTPAQVGFNAGDGIKYYSVEGSQTSDIINLPSKTNIGVPGKFMFQVANEEIQGFDIEVPATTTTPTSSTRTFEEVYTTVAAQELTSIASETSPVSTIANAFNLTTAEPSTTVTSESSPSSRLTEPEFSVTVTNGSTSTITEVSLTITDITQLSDSFTLIGDSLSTAHQMSVTGNDAAEDTTSTQVTHYFTITSRESSQILLTDFMDLAASSTIIEGTTSEKISTELTITDVTLLNDSVTITRDTPSTTHQIPNNVTDATEITNSTEIADYFTSASREPSQMMLTDITHLAASSTIAEVTTSANIPTETHMMVSEISTHVMLDDEYSTSVATNVQSVSMETLTTITKTITPIVTDVSDVSNEAHTTTSSTSSHSDTASNIYTITAIISTTVNDNTKSALIQFGSMEVTPSVIMSDEISTALLIKSTSSEPTIILYTETSLFTTCQVISCTANDLTTSSVQFKSYTFSTTETSTHADHTSIAPEEGTTADTATDEAIIPVASGIMTTSTTNIFEASDVSEVMKTTEETHASSTPMTTIETDVGETTDIFLAETTTLEIYTVSNNYDAFVSDSVNNIGIGVGISSAVVVLLVVGTGYWTFFVRKRRQVDNNEVEDSSEETNYSNNVKTQMMFEPYFWDMIYV